MRILGLHFGHDSAVSLIEDGVVKFLAQSERYRRQKHATGLNYQFVMECINRAEIKVSQLDYCAITTTQGIDIVVDAGKPFDVRLARHRDDSLPSSIEKISKGMTESELARLIDPGRAMPQQLARRTKRLERVAPQLGISSPNVRQISGLNQYFLDDYSSVVMTGPLWVVRGEC